MTGEALKEIQKIEERAGQMIETARKEAHHLIFQKKEALKKEAEKAQKQAETEGQRMIAAARQEAEELVKEITANSQKQLKALKADISPKLEQAKKSLMKG